ncbi:MAG TPA: DUF3592 domain-containing protein [Chthonomonadales bacterium]|nr:DUF3592 domain-containing protein [Chthonomonadales bacterium]
MIVSGSSPRPAFGCFIAAFAVGLCWLGISLFRCRMYYQQETGKLRRNGDIDRNMGRPMGEMVSSTSGGRGMTSEWYNITYRYTPAGGQERSDMEVVPDNQLATLGLAQRSASFLFADNPPGIIEYDRRDPSLSRLKVIKYHGGSSLLALWGGVAAGVFIGLLGFLFLAGGMTGQLLRPIR